MKKCSLFVFTLLVSIFYTSGLAAQSAEIDDRKLLITGFQVSSTKEYVELYNSSTDVLSVEGWKVTYTNASGGNLKTVISLTGLILPRSHVLFTSPDFATEANLETLLLPYSSLAYTGMADSGGFLRLYEKVTSSSDYPDGFQLLGIVGWKNTSTASTDTSILSIVGLKSVKRCTNLLGEYVVRQNNQTDFYVNSAPELLSLGLLCADLVPIEPPPVEEPADDTEEPPPEVIEEPSCEGVVINEILPNASGDDSGKEFIELVNLSSNAVDLKGCILEIGTKQHIFDASEILQPATIRAYNDIVTGITLPNSSGGTLRLISLNGVEISSVAYPEDMEDDQSWAKIGTGFLATYMPTPGVPNVDMLLRPCDDGEVRDEATNYCSKVTVQETIVCASNQVLNPDTKRCNKVEDVSASVCRAGQERNPATNRCRNIVGTTLASALTPCLDGQLRNPATNRCKAIAVTTLSACKEGQERNSETNRCRTIVLASTDSIEVQDIETAPNSQKDWLAGVVVGLAALSYGVYEWRQEVSNILKKVFARKRSTV